jgi:hypothetical protein
VVGRVVPIVVHKKAFKTLCRAASQRLSRDGTPESLIDSLQPSRQLWSFNLCGQDFFFWLT